MLQIQKLDRCWNFRRLTGSGAADAPAVVDLPHSAVTVDIDGHGHWFGECEYRKRVCVPTAPAGSRIALYIAAAMHTAVVAVDGRPVGRHIGGYLPFEVDLTAHLNDGVEHELSITIDNRDNADIPPGKSFADLDFCWYGGLYRDVELRVYAPIHITDAVAAGEVAGGGVLVRTLSASDAEAMVSIKAHVRNGSRAETNLAVVVELLLSGKAVATNRASLGKVGAGVAVHGEVELTVVHPRLWSPTNPKLYSARVFVCDDSGQVLDERVERFGIRRIAFSRSGGFVINGRRVRLRGTNRHQEYPYLGYALPRAAQVRDAVRIKEAGFDYVRLSHYPQAPDFLNACDELGIVVMNAIPGWQFIGGEKFRENCYQHARDLIRRDRNHPCVVLWELSLNETDMPEEFMARLHAIGHEEMPGDQMFTCGWMDRYDVYIHSRQHGEMHRWRNGDKALVIAEYGDWEFYAANHGFDQKTGAGLHAAWSNSRQFRSSGERGLRQQATNHIIALNDTLSSPAVLDGQWTVFDYVRGYHPVRAGTGIMDVFRLPKYSYYFYRSQRSPEERGENWKGGPMVFIASEWTASSSLRVLVFSNCDEVELRLNGKSCGRQKPAKAISTQYLPHPPFVFDLSHYVPGKLEALGFFQGKPAATHAVGTFGAAVQLELSIETLEVAAPSHESDLLFAHAQWLDLSGFVCSDEDAEVRFSLEGDGRIVGPDRVVAEAGIASVLIQVPADARAFTLFAVSENGMVTTNRSWQRSPADAPRLTAVPQV
ncbi:MAG: glycoside hydrolase family 2 TIM barrel-domain containing protein [Nibricoccus sp.]